MNTTMILLGTVTYLGAVIVFFSLLSFARKIEEAEFARVRPETSRDRARRF